jgi:hypothetical protein
MDARRRWIVLLSVLIALDGAALIISGISSAGDSSGELHPLTVSGMFGSAMLREDVYVTGTVSEVLSDHVSKTGFLYQQFLISDGVEEIKIFCSQKYGKSIVAVGNEIVASGTFQKYYGEYEIYGFCFDVKKT